MSSAIPTALLKSWRGGDRDALDRLMPVVYDELSRIREQRPGPFPLLMGVTAIAGAAGRCEAPECCGYLESV